MQIVCLTIAPAFMAGGIYLCLRRIVYTFGPANSRISPEAYTRIFIPCDFISLLMQAAGGGLASAESHSGKSPDTGDNIMVAGLAFQVLTLAIFICLCLDFGFNTLKRWKELGEGALDPQHAQLRSSRKFKGFLVALALSTICILIRSVYRVAEMGEGWTGHLIKQQWLFFGLEGIMVIVAVISLNVFHPAVCFGDGMAGLGGLGTKKKARAAAMAEAEVEKNQEEPAKVSQDASLKHA
jgi:RTA1 like protein